MRVLVVEDEVRLAATLQDLLELNGYTVDVCHDGEAGLDNALTSIYDVILLDVMLPKLDGFGVCELIRRQSRVPIILLTALDGEAEQLRGFDLEIDDYVTKPFSMPVLLRKIGAVLRRVSGSAGGAELLRYGELTLDLDALEVRLGGEPLPEKLTLRASNSRNAHSQYSSEPYTDKSYPHGYNSHLDSRDSRTCNLSYPRKAVRYSRSSLSSR